MVGHTIPIPCAATACHDENEAPVRAQAGNETSARLCGCGCGVPLTPRQAQYASRACTQRALWADPAQQAKRVTALRKAKVREGVTHWWADARLRMAWATLTRTGALAGFTDAGRAQLRLALADTMRDTYQRGYRAGRDSLTRRARSRRAA